MWIEVAVPGVIRHLTVNVCVLSISQVPFYVYVGFSDPRLRLLTSFLVYRPE